MSSRRQHQVDDPLHCTGGDGRDGGSDGERPHSRCIGIKQVRHVQ